jgi:hypothetical protein
VQEMSNMHKTEAKPVAGELRYSATWLPNVENKRDTMMEFAARRKGRAGTGGG